ncbi:hypothetical protein QR680_014522 [Steinernema hermaphroditum]|uniref:F-box domain-containing protein n=1 Tax=Steinernema hermaphroditum TaxID=289476 RepID=A0AA39I953_9BILA|nr:hypothetical protein QR680_014522 [Steinernema hermaphroditum]
MGNELSILCDGTDLINTLPDEVLVKIFRYTYDGDCFAPFSYPDIDEEFPRTDKPKEKAIRPLRLVCFRWNRLITGFFTFRRWVRMYIECGKHGLTGEIWTSGKKWTNLEMGEREFPRHVLRYFTKEIVVLLNITNEKDYPLTSNHIKTICEWFTRIHHIRSICFSCRKIVASKHEIETLFNSLRRPDTLISLQLTGYAMSPHTDAISTFIEAHPNLKVICEEVS